MRILLISLASILAIAISGCKKEEPNPELLDPIYSDLSKDLTVIDAAKEESEKNLEADKKSLEKSPPRTIERRNAEEDLLKEQGRFEHINQLLEYYKIRVARRLVESRRNYKLAFQADKAWPDPQEYEAYKVNKRLMNASKNWSDRVPKFPSSGGPPAEALPEKPKTEGEAAAAEEQSSSAAHSGKKEGVKH